MADSTAAEQARRQPAPAAATARKADGQQSMTLVVEVPPEHALPPTRLGHFVIDGRKLTVKVPDGLEPGLDEALTSELDARGELTSGLLTSPALERPGAGAIYGVRGPAPAAAAPPRAPQPDRCP